MNIDVHRLYYGPVGENGITLKTTPAIREGNIISEDLQSDIYTLKAPFNKTVDSSELLYTAQGPVIRVTRIKPIQSHDKRTTQSCNITLLVQLSEISQLLLPLLDEELTFPLETVKLKVTREG
jgi:hypothetical protein